jgi:hypothetical protein
LGRLWCGCCTTSSRCSWLGQTTVSRAGDDIRHGCIHSLFVLQVRCHACTQTLVRVLHTCQCAQDEAGVRQVLWVDWHALGCTLCKLTAACTSLCTVLGIAVAASADWLLLLLLHCNCYNPLPLQPTQLWLSWVPSSMKC